MSNLADQIEQFIGTVDRYEFFWEAFSTMRDESQGASIASGASATMSHLHINRHNAAMDAMRIGQSIASSALIPESESRTIFTVMNACTRGIGIRNVWPKAKVELQCLVKNVRTVPIDPGGPPGGTETTDSDDDLPRITYKCLKETVHLSQKTLSQIARKAGCRKGIPGKKHLFSVNEVRGMRTIVAQTDPDEMLLWDQFISEQSTVTAK